MAGDTFICIWDISDPFYIEVKTELLEPNTLKIADSLNQKSRALLNLQSFWQHVSCVGIKQITFILFTHFCLARDIAVAMIKAQL